jgi:tetratricopeptide (TPR) repeat protein
MNEATPSTWRRILSNAGTEPRHFFFWLATLGLVGMMLTLALTVAADRVLPILPWLGLAGILAFLIGVPGFVLAWIPPLRRLFARLLPYKVLIAASIATLIALFYTIENWRGRTAWNAYRQECESKGIFFTADKVMPPKIPDAENMFAAPPWVSLSPSNAESASSLGQAESLDENWPTSIGPLRPRPPGLTGWYAARRGADLEAWQEFYRGTNNLIIPALDIAPTNFFPVAPKAQTPAQDILFALSKYDESLKQLRAAAQRPGARFEVKLEEGFAMVMPHLNKVRGIAQFLQLRSIALLHDGQNDAALQDFLLLVRINDATAAEPTLISQLVRISVSQISLAILWEGLAGHYWDESQLAALERELAKMDLLRDYHTGMSGERFFSIWTVDFLKRTGDLDALFGPTGPGEVEVGFGEQIIAATGKNLFRLIPSGWFDQNKLSLGRLHVDYLLPMVDAGKQLVEPASSSKKFQQAAAAPPSPYNLFASQLLPALDKVASKAAVAQTYVNLARLAVALERHRLATGQFPKSLDQLTPRFLSTIPHDIINGEPLKYRTNDGLFLLYSVGWNETDDGGEVGLNKGGNFDQRTGDWVWRYPAE